MNKRYFYPVKMALILLLLTGTGCNDWLNVKPENEQANEDFWKTKEDVQAVVMSGYVQLERCLESLVYWGELRGDGLALGANLNSNEDVLAIKSLSIEPMNPILSWTKVYSAIGRCNAVIEYSDMALESDRTFTQEASDAYKAEATWIRSLCYFYLVRSFCDVPYVTLPYLDDNRDFRTPKTDGKKVLEYITADLQAMIRKIPVSYNRSTWEDKGRATLWAYYALLADIYLWSENYEKAIEMCETIERSGLFELMASSDWYKLYYPGNSRESIFELQWDATKQQTNDLFAWFNNNEDNSRFLISESAIAKFTEDPSETDIRGAGASYLSTNAAKTNNKCWKYAGTDIGGGNLRGGDQHDANWIVYRYADILLMKAEALVMRGSAADYDAAYALISQIRTRAGYLQQLKMPENESEYLDLILDERLREFSQEGKRWFDLVRVAVRNNGKYKNKLINLLLVNVDAKDRPRYEVKLQDIYGYYFPINDSDISASDGILIQNPYYL